MPQPMRRKVADQVLIQLIEADVDIGFALLDEARGCHAMGELDNVSRALQETEDVVADIDRRLRDLGESEAVHFLPLVNELREDLAQTRREMAA